MIIGREAEWDFLNSHYQSEESRILVLYGRRGLGKTTILKDFIANKSYFYYLARSCSEKEQRLQWGRELRQKGISLSADPDFEELLDKSCYKDTKGKKILVLDEFQYFVKSDSSFFSELIQFIKATQEFEPIMVILISGAVGWVENIMIRKIGRGALSLSGVWKVREMKYAGLRRLFPEFTDSEAVAIYGILGGNPGLWKSFLPGKSLEENITQTVLEPFGGLREEPESWLSEELRETAVYQTILSALASGLTKLNDIHVHTGFSRAKISVYLKNLMELDLVDKLSSYETAGYANSQKGIYRISHPFVDFYFRVIFPNQSALELLSTEEFYAVYVKNAIYFYEEQAYERICREYLKKYCEDLGEWWGKEGKIPFLGRKKSGETFAAFSRYHTIPTSEELLQFCKNLRKAKWAPSECYLFCEKSEEISLEINATGIKKESFNRIAILNDMYPEGSGHNSGL